MLKNPLSSTSENQPNSFDECLQKRQQEGRGRDDEAGSVRSSRRATDATEAHGCPRSRQVRRARVPAGFTRTCFQHSDTKPFKQDASFLLQVLSGYGAKFDSYDEFGNNPIHYAAMDGRAMCIKFLAQRGSSSPSFMKCASCAWLVM